jgi:hypothetical protein
MLPLLVKDVVERYFAGQVLLGDNSGSGWSRSVMNQIAVLFLKDGEYEKAH